MEKCRWCGNIHGQMCPEIKSIEYDPPGSAQVKRVEFMTLSDKLMTVPGSYSPITQPGLITPQWL